MTILQNKHMLFKFMECWLKNAQVCKAKIYGFVGKRQRAILFTFCVLYFEYILAFVYNMNQFILKRTKTCNKKSVFKETRSLQKNAIQSKDVVNFILGFNIFMCFYIAGATEVKIIGKRGKDETLWQLFIGEPIIVSIKTRRPFS